MPNSLRSFWQAIRPETRHTPDLSWEQAQQVYETVYMPSRNLAARTRVEYRTDVAQLIAFLKGSGITNPSQAGSIHLQAFLAHLDGKGLTGFIRRRKAAAIRGFFGFLTANGYLPRNPSERLIPPVLAELYIRSEISLMVGTPPEAVRQIEIEVEALTNRRQLVSCGRFLCHTPK